MFNPKNTPQLRQLRFESAMKKPFRTKSEQIYIRRTDSLICEMQEKVTEVKHFQQQVNITKSHIKDSIIQTQQSLEETIIERQKQILKASKFLDFGSNSNLAPGKSMASQVLQSNRPSGMWKNNLSGDQVYAIKKYRIDKNIRENVMKEFKYNKNSVQDVLKALTYVFSGAITVNLSKYKFQKQSYSEKIGNLIKQLEDESKRY
ncbi:Hypothetical_protein [Hexamita inflata]|uniref:Hypothetical_protein n=1 Tax=Hexamita inflata TaxID=28002 RepID=A0AA86U1N6_9EUKA|nr:Hypothetical protein HINF_LOCUS15498 [Hexamita inflata]